MKGKHMNKYKRLVVDFYKKDESLYKYAKSINFQRFIKIALANSYQELLQVNSAVDDMIHLLSAIQMNDNEDYLRLNEAIIQIKERYK